MKYRPEYDLKVIGNNLKRLRLAKSLSVEDVREYLRLGSVQAVYKYEQGKGYPQTDTMFALMELYGAQLSDIICEPETKRRCINAEGCVPSTTICKHPSRDLQIVATQETGNRLREKQSERIKKYYETLETGMAS